MTMSKDVYAEFEAIVGPEFICADPAIMPSYHNTAHAAVILPENTAQVQAIIRLCNKHKVRFRPVCTGWTGRFEPGMLYMDLRRMNRIIEINEKNMYAVVEPYVISAQLQAELMKRGLHMNVKGAGTNCSAMLRGHGHLDQSTSGDDRNHLAIEWVTPAGDIVRSGSLGSADEWFSGDGPGPSLRSILTSAVPPGATPGVFTKAAMKIYHWPGPTKFPVVGASPNYQLSEVPPNMMARYYSFPSVDQMWQAELKLGEAEIAFELMGFNIAMVAANISTSNEEEEETFKRLSKEIQGPGFFIIIAGNSAADFAYKKRVLNQIVSDNNGKSVTSLEDPRIEGILLCQCIRISASIRETFRPGGMFKSIPVMGQRDLTIKWAIGAGKAKEPLIAKGLIVDDGGAAFGWGVEQGHLGKTEIFCKFDPHNAEAQKAVDAWHFEQSDRAFKERYFALLGYRNEPNATEEIGQALSSYHKWWNEIQKAFDPNRVSPEGGALV
ncbi:MAG: FAD-binding oxidoreductase [Gammaproteobacteria bacterium]|nr:MAG: FAD-binding oxidoreductase [Gammaproteobacteria bacterium]